MSPNETETAVCSSSIFVCRMTGEATGGYSVYIPYILPTALTCTMAFLHSLGELYSTCTYSHTFSGGVSKEDSNSFLERTYV